MRKAAEETFSILDMFVDQLSAAVGHALDYHIRVVEAVELEVGSRNHLVLKVGQRDGLEGPGGPPMPIPSTCPPCGAMSRYTDGRPGLMPGSLSGIGTSRISPSSISGEVMRDIDAVVRPTLAGNFSPRQRPRAARFPPSPPAGSGYPCLRECDPVACRHLSFIFYPSRKYTSRPVPEYYNAAGFYSTEMWKENHLNSARIAYTP